MSGLLQLLALEENLLVPNYRTGLLSSLAPPSPITKLNTVYLVISRTLHIYRKQAAVSTNFSFEFIVFL